MLSYSIMESIPIMNLFNEMKEVVFPVESSNDKAHCKVSKNNSGALEIARIPKFHPRTNSFKCRLHHFRSYVNYTKEKYPQD